METENTSAGEGASWLGWQQANAALEVFQTVVDEVMASLSNYEASGPVCDWIDSELTPLIEDYQELLFNSEDSLADAIETIKTLTKEAESFAETMRGLDEIESEMEDLGEEDGVEVEMPNTKTKKGGKPIDWDAEMLDDADDEDEASSTGVSEFLCVRRFQKSADG